MPRALPSQLCSSSCLPRGGEGQGPCSFCTRLDMGPRRLRQEIGWPWICPCWWQQQQLFMNGCRDWEVQGRVSGWGAREGVSSFQFMLGFLQSIGHSLGCHSTDLLLQSQKTFHEEHTTAPERKKKKKAIDTKVV